MIEQLQALLGNDMLRLHLSAVVLGMIRIGAFATIAPLLGPGVTSPVRFPIILALYLPLHPCMVETVRVLGTSTTMDMIMLLLIIGKEVLLGVFMGWLVSLFFYIALSAGTIVDNQRGASMAQTADLLSGAEASPLGSLLFMAAVTLFFVSGSFTRFMELFYTSFLYWPPSSLLPDLGTQETAIFAAANVTWMMKQTMLIAAPFMVVALVCDVSLGLINRFAPQLNVFILSMPIKSGVCSLLVIFYYTPFLSHSNGNFDIMNQIIEYMFSFIDPGTDMTDPSITGQ